jgi:hypothetical protein
MVQRHTNGNRRRRGERVVGKFPRLESLIDRIVEAANPLWIAHFVAPGVAQNKNPN